MTNTHESATSDEIEEWEEENDEPHPIFEVPHRPERKPLKSEVGRCESCRNWPDEPHEPDCPAAFVPGDDEE